MDRINWNKLWKDSRKAAEKNSAVEFWDSFASSFRKKVNEPDPYIEKFYELAEIQPGDRLFDMGCASGTLAIPYAQKGHEVYAADFSEEMLKVLMEGAEAAGVADRIHPIKLNWNEDWSLRDLPKCEVAFASRSLIVEDLTEALKKLESVAIRRCCVGVWDTPVKGYDRYLAKAIAYERPGYGVHWFVVNELMDRDRFPEMFVLRSPFRVAKFKTYEEGVQMLKETFQYGLTFEQEKALEDYCRNHLKHHELEDGGERSARGDAQGEKEFWQLDHSDMSTMTFIRWDM